MDDLNHPVMYHECTTAVKDLGHIVQQAEAVHLWNTINPLRMIMPNESTTLL
jgi:hypothetical protein